jgi:phosphoserine phosphatase RsbU/P
MPVPRILIADDQADILQALRLLLTDSGFETDLVASVDGVLDRLSGEPYDLLLMDLNYSRDTTSGREGLDLLERVRARDPLLPVVVMTGWGSIETAVEAMRRCAKSFVEKPWDNLTLVEIVRREVGEGQATRRRDARFARDQEEAGLIQRALLPSTMPVMTGCQIAAAWMPASGIGGDCYDVLRFSDTCVAVSIADVVGKGLPAALLMSNLQAAVRAFAIADADPLEVCGSINRLLCRNIASGKFVSFCYAVLDTTARTIRYSNAGHNHPVLVHADGQVERLETSGRVLGVTTDWTYTTGTLAMHSANRLVCFTDGLTDADSPTGKEFGDERLVETIRRHRGESAEGLTRIVSETVLAWTGGAFQDDATLVVVAID